MTSPKDTTANGSTGHDSTTDSTAHDSTANGATAHGRTADHSTPANSATTDGGTATGRGAPQDTPVEAAGCVLWRRSPVDGELEVCLVHRPKYDDWSHPKGKLKHGEDPLSGALREVAEETGYAAVPGSRLPTMRYLANGRPKQVRYWAAEAADGGFTPNDEVDRILWLPPAAARNRLTQPRDRTLIDELLGPLRIRSGPDTR